jgi:hypothetical protein
MTFDASGIRTAPRMKTKYVVALVSITSLHAAGSVAAQAVDEILLDASYLAAPTAWCPANLGVPMTVKMDGPNIIKGPREFPRKITVRRGGSVQVVDGEFIASFNRPEDFAGPNAEVTGRFSAEFRTCFSPWDLPRVTGTWRLSGNDGSELDSGAFEDEFLGDLHSLFFKPVSGPSQAQYAKFGDRVLFSAGTAKVTITQTFLAKPDKE